jgi:hypothetical protein
VLVAPSEIGSVCGGSGDVLFLDGSLSFGFNAMTPHFEWTFQTFVNGSLTTPQSLYAAPFAAGFSSSNDTVTLPSALLAVDTPYIFYLLAARSSLSSSSSSTGLVSSTRVSATVTRRDRSLLKVTPRVSVQVRRATPLSLSVDVTVCAQPLDSSDRRRRRRRRLLASSSSSPPARAYTWTQIAGPPLLVALNYNAYRLLIPANTLQTYGAYEFSVVVSSVDDALAVAAANATATFVVRPSTPIALLAGTQYRSLAFGEELTLDASSSFDVDYPARGSSQLAFFWPFPALTAATPVMAACQVQHDAFILTWTILTLTSPLLLLPSRLLCPGLEYTFTVVVAHASLPPGFEGAASATTFTVVRGDAEPPPPVANTVVHALAVSIAFINADRFFLSAFPFNERLRLQATVSRTITTFGVFIPTAAAPTGSVPVVSVVENTHTDVNTEGGYTLRYRWSETNAHFDARAASNLAGAADASTLVLSESALVPLPSAAFTGTFTLRLDVTLVSPLDVDVVSAFSKIDVIMNTPPTLERAVVKSADWSVAMTGTAGDSEFAVECIGAADAHEPLQFTFYYAVVDDDVTLTPSSSDLVPLTERSAFARANIRLPVGKVVVVCYAYDAFGARSLPSTPTAVVTVTPQQNVVSVNQNGTCVGTATLTAQVAPSLFATQSVTASLQQVSGVITSALSNKECASLQCSLYDAFVNAIVVLLTAANEADEVTDSTARMLSSTLQVLVVNSTLCACPKAFGAATRVMRDLVTVVSAANKGTNTLAPIGCFDCLTSTGAEAVLRDTSRALSALLSQDCSLPDVSEKSIQTRLVSACEQFDEITDLVEETLTASAAGSLAGEASVGIVTPNIVASTRRVDGVSAAAAGRAAIALPDASMLKVVLPHISFDFPAESVADFRCVNLQVVEYVSPGGGGVSCRSDALVATTLRQASGDSPSGLNLPASAVVEADVFDCEGKVLNITGLTVPISFIIPITSEALLLPSQLTSECAADTSYLPSDSNIAAQLVQVEKEVECSYFDEDVQDWRSDGCVVADRNVTQADGSRAVRCECAHLTEFAILLRESARAGVTECNRSPNAVFGSVIFLVFAVLFSLLLVVGARQTHLTYWAFAMTQKTMLAQHVLLSLVCVFRIFVCVMYFELQHASVREIIEFKAVAAVSGLPYVLMLWLFSLLVTNWASIYYAAQRRDLTGMRTAFRRLLPYFVRSNAAGSVFFMTIFL